MPQRPSTRIPTLRIQGSPGPEKAPTVYLCRCGHEQESVSTHCLVCRGSVEPKHQIDLQHAQALHGMTFGRPGGGL